MYILHHVCLRRVGRKHVCRICVCVTSSREMGYLILFQNIKKYSCDGLPTTIEAHVTAHTHMEGIYDPTAGMLSAYYSYDMFQHDITLIEAGDAQFQNDMSLIEAGSADGFFLMRAIHLWIHT